MISQTPPAWATAAAAILFAAFLAAYVPIALIRNLGDWALTRFFSLHTGHRHDA